jgi:hypothetical protein
VELSTLSVSASAGLREAAAPLGAGNVMWVALVPSGSVSTRIKPPTRRPTSPAAVAEAARFVLGIISCYFPERTLADPRSRIYKRPG